MTQLTLRFNGPIPKYFSHPPTGETFHKQRLSHRLYRQKSFKNNLHKKTLSRYPSQRKKQSQH